MPALSPLMLSRRFMPLFAVQFLSALCDNIYRSAMLMQLTFLAKLTDTQENTMLVAAASAIFIAPYFLFSATAGQLSDKFAKTRMTRGIKLIEAALFAFAGVALWLSNLELMFISLFLLGVSATFFGPIKFSLLPELMEEDELVAANSLTEAGTFLAILLGSIIGGTLIIAGSEPTGWFAGFGALPVVLLLAGLATLTAALSWAIPLTPAAQPQLKVDANIFRATLPVLQTALRQKVLARTIYGISWLWFVGSVFLALFPPYVRDVLQGEAELATLFLTTFSLGIALGSALCQKLLQGVLSTQFVPLGALGMALGAFALYGTSGAFAWSSESHSFWDFIALPMGWLILASMFVIAFFGGIFSVPLYVLLQVKSPESARARIVAANNIVNSVLMVLSSAYIAAVLALGGTMHTIFWLTGALGLCVTLYSCLLLPQALTKSLFRIILQLAYKVKLHGAENALPEGQKAVYVVNHLSFIDGLLVGAFLPGRPIFAVNTHITRFWWAKLFLALVDYRAIDPTNPLALKTLIASVNTNRALVIFPEGRLTQTGALMKVYEGPGLIAEKTGAPIVPVRLDGVQYTPFSKLRGKFRLRWFPQVTITILSPLQLNLPAELAGRARRQAAADRLYRIMSDMMFATAPYDATLWQSLLDAAKMHGSKTVILEDINRKPLTYGGLVTRALALGRELCHGSAAGEKLGVLLPNSNGTAVSFFALQAYGRVPAMLNYTSGLSNLRAALLAAEVKTIITSRRFIAAAKLGTLLDGLATERRILFLEDCSTRIGHFAKLHAALLTPFARHWHRRHAVTPDAPAVVLFTSGSEGVPKGVVLSHRNILANRQQLAARIDFNAADIVFNALPLFHSFGLTAGFLLPALSGVRSFLYPSPLHYRIVPELCYDVNATILFGTDTFLTGYARMAHPYDFYSLRYVFAGAEKVRDVTRLSWAQKFGLRILEGYGATETAPVLAINTPMALRPGSVGQLLPGITAKLEAVPGITDGGKLCVKGPNIMLGYLKTDKPGVLQPPEDGWYDTGDIVTLDADGFVTIIGRVKRFAKIAGEMVSLGAVEQFVQPLLAAEKQVAVVAIPDERKGEQLILFTTDAALTRETLAAAARTANLPELMVPRTLYVLEKLPVLGTGKIDYVLAKEMASERAAAKLGTAITQEEAAPAEHQN